MLPYLILDFVVVPVEGVLVVGAEDGDVIAALERRRLKTHVHLEFETASVRFYP